MKKIEKNCHTCQDYIVCYAYKKLPADENQTGCPDWQIDINIYQDLTSEERKAFDFKNP